MGPEYSAHLMGESCVVLSYVFSTLEAIFVTVENPVAGEKAMKIIPFVAVSSRRHLRYSRVLFGEKNDFLQGKRSQFALR